jgi:hypothetical protein
VRLLPYLGRQDLYRQYAFDEPWDSPDNLRLAARIAEMYQWDGDSGRRSQEMTDFVFVVRSTVPFSERASASFVDNSAGAQEILVVEIARSDIHVLEPRDLDFDTMSFVVNDRNTASISTLRSGDPLVGFVDGKVRPLSISTPPDTLRKWLLVSETRNSNGGQ